MKPDAFLAGVERYYASKVLEFGATAKGADWKDGASQRLRFEQLLKICDTGAPFAINDYGCGYGALAGYLDELGLEYVYAGFDISPPMLDEAQRRYGSSGKARFVSTRDGLPKADYTVASGIFNVKLDAEERDWQGYVLTTLGELDAISERGFSFNMLTSYSDQDKKRDDLYYANPGFVFDHCKRAFSRWVALLHDYPLYEFTVLVRKEDPSA
ncbi:MAG: class I SAM-dependent methyltransferase [Gaiellaceae bacterium]